MNPEIDQMLGVSATQLMCDLAPLLPAGYAQGSASLLSLMMELCAREYDRAAEIRAADNSEMRALFGELAPSVSDAPLRLDLKQAAETADNSLKISALNESNVRLRRLLVALQIHLEGQNDTREAQMRVWDVLKASAARRLVKLA